MATRDRAETATVTDERPRMRAFISPRGANTRYLIERGPDVLNELRRQDIFAEFVNGVCASRDPRVITFLEAHDVEADLEKHFTYHMAREETELADNCIEFGFCIDAENPRAGAWADIEDRKLPRANREAQLPRDYDVQALLAGRSPTASGNDRAVDAAHEIMSRSGERGRDGAGGNHPETFWQADPPADAVVSEE